MATLRKDPLLGAAHVILALGIALLVFVMAMILIGLGAILTVGRGEVMAELTAAGAPDTVYWAVVVALLMSEAFLFVILRFILELLGIVKSVGRGDPFEPANAGRLSRMGWLMIGVYAVGIPMNAITAWIKRVSGEAGENIDANLSLGASGILLILVLFILARVFRKGAKMREDLEGTV